MGFDKKAQRSKQKLRLCLTGASGSGKTYSALLIAQGLGGKIGLLDSENGSGSLYEDVCEYFVEEIQAPFEPDKYIAKIKEAESSGIEILIIDSLTHVWAGEGGLLTIHENASKTAKNSFAAWATVNPKQNKLIQAILTSKMHIIITLRSKVDYVLETNDKGKQVPRKIGLAPIFREGLDYEFTAVLDLSLDGHIAQSTKDRTGIFDGNPILPTIDTGKRLLEWLNIGVERKSKSEISEQSLIAIMDRLQNATFLAWASFVNSVSELKLQLTEEDLKKYESEAKKRYGELKALHSEDRKSVV